MCLNFVVADPAALEAAQRLMEGLTWPHRVLRTTALGFDKLSYQWPSQLVSWSLLTDDCDPAIAFAASQQSSLWLNRRLALVGGTADLHDVAGLPAETSAFFMLQVRDMPDAVDSVDQAMRQLDTAYMFQIWDRDGNDLFRAFPPQLVITPELRLNVDHEGALRPSLSGRPVTYSTFALAAQCADVATGLTLLNELRGITHTVNAIAFVADAN